MLTKSFAAAALVTAFVSGSMAMADSTTTVYKTGRNTVTTVTTAPAAPVTRTTIIKTMPTVTAPIVITPVAAPVSESITKTTVTRTDNLGGPASVTESTTERTIQTTP